MSDIEWQDPPSKAKRGYQSKYVGVAAELKSRPGRWARVNAGASSTSITMYIKRKLGAGFEVLSRKADGPGYDTYARFVGEDGTR